MNKLQLEVHKLQKGMYVCELDRPWSDTAFLFQGFRITNDHELSMLAETCEYVFVDAEKSTVSVESNLASYKPGVNQAKKKPKKSSVTTRVVQTQYKKTFDEEFPVAKQLFNQSFKIIKRIFTDIRLGKNIEVNEVRTTVSSLAESIIRHPDALKLLCSFSEKNEESINHALHVCVLTLAFGHYIGLPENKLYELGMGALLHDIGEIRVSDEVLNKKEPFTEEENQEFQLHTSYGIDILKNIKGLPPVVLDITGNHHERLNGTGYPKKISGSELSSNTMLVSIVDVYDKVTMGLEHKPVVTPTEALKNMYNWRNELFDSDMIELFIQCLGIYPVGSVVELKTGEIGIVVTFDDKKRLLPKVMLVKDNKGKFYNAPRMLDLNYFKNEDNDYEIKRVINAEDNGIDVRNYILRELHSEMVVNN